MANSSLTLSSIDFDSLKNNFKEFLKTQSVFKDYDFNGSNINVLLDVMAYNSYLNSFYLNMVASEMFLDSAQKYDSIVSHAKELNYVPRSARSSTAEISFNVETIGLTGNFTIPKGTRFFGVNSNGTFTFTTDEASSYVSGNGTYAVANLMIYEGDYFNDSYLVDYDIENQQFLISNRNVDIGSLTVTVTENNGANVTTFLRAETLFNLDSESNVYFLQGAQNERYEIVFGDGLFGRKPINGAIVNLNYRVTNGTNADGISEFDLLDDIGPINNGVVITPTINVTMSSVGGANLESQDSIKFAAPRYFATQQRAVSSDDYASLVLNNFGGEISDVAVYGGETVEPKLYGRVIVSVKPSSGDIAPNYIKNRISNYLLDFIALPNRVLITDPDYLYCYVKSTVQYDPITATKTASEIQSAVLNKIINYSSVNLEKFENDFRYSRLVREIDNSDNSITSNDTEIRLIKRIAPKINTPTSYAIELNNEIYYDSFGFDTLEQHSLTHSSEADVITNHAGLVSSKFTYISSSGVSYPFAFLEDDAMSINSNGDADIKVLYFNNDVLTYIETVGKINYINGTVSLTNFTASTYGNYISMYFRLIDKDIYANKNKIIRIDPNDVIINITEVRR